MPKAFVTAFFHSFASPATLKAELLSLSLGGLPFQRMIRDLRTEYHHRDWTDRQEPKIRHGKCGKIKDGFE